MKTSKRVIMSRMSFVVLFALMVTDAIGQHSGTPVAPPTEMDVAHEEMSILDVQVSQARGKGGGQESRSEAVSKFDLEAPRRAKKEFQKGLVALSKKDLSNAIEHLSNATRMYPAYVSAHNALGVSYMRSGQAKRARDEFQTAAALDDHVPESFANLCSAAISIGDYPAAQQAIERASSLAPLNLEFLTTSAFAEFLNRQYQSTITTAQKVHARNHENAAIVHYLAGLSWQSLGNLDEMRHELGTFLSEDPKNPSSENARLLLARSSRVEADSKEVSPTREPTAAELKERQQVAEAEALCEGCSDSSVAPDREQQSQADRHSSPPTTNAGWLFRKSVDEVQLFFSATDHGKSVSDLKVQDIHLWDNNEAPAAIMDFRSEVQLPLRLGIVIDTSDSVNARFGFEQQAARRFLQSVLTGPDDLAFMVAFANSVLLIQDFTPANDQLQQALQKLAPGGGTALWDAVTFASQKLTSQRERQATAKVLVVISDGEDNSSTETLRQAIEEAENDQVTVYAIDTGEHPAREVGSTRTGERALKVLSEQTGGALFAHGSIDSLDRSFNELSQIVRSRYLISYKPSHLDFDGRFRNIKIRIDRADRRLRVYARKGYYAKLPQEDQGRLHASEAPAMEAR
jgi:Ca-activated chloride channel family protein